MKKKQVKHFVSNKDSNGSGFPACGCFWFSAGNPELGHTHWGEVAKTRRGVTCRRCRNTRVFRGLK
jgi:hypothetical protein